MKRWLIIGVNKTCVHDNVYQYFELFQNNEQIARYIRTAVKETSMRNYHNIEGVIAY